MRVLGLFLSQKPSPKLSDKSKLEQWEKWIRLEYYLRLTGEAMASPREAPQPRTKENNGVVITWTYSGLRHHLNAKRTDHCGSIPVQQLLLMKYNTEHSIIVVFSNRKS